MLGRIVVVLVDARQQEDIGIVADLARRAHQHPLGAPVEMRLRTRSRGGATGAIDHQIDTQGGPVRKLLGRIDVCDRPVPDLERRSIGDHRFRENAVVGIDLEERRQSRQVLDIRNRNRSEKIVLQARCEAPSGQSARTREFLRQPCAGRSFLLA